MVSQGIACPANDSLRNSRRNLPVMSNTNFQLHPDLQRDGIRIGSFPLCLVLLINDKSYPWFVLVPQRAEIRDPIDLSDADYRVLWQESHRFSGAIMSIFNGEKLNIAALGNMTPQLHVHHVVRFNGDAAWPAPIWGKQPLVAYSDDELDVIRDQIVAAKIEGLTPTTTSKPPTSRSAGDDT